MKKIMIFGVVTILVQAMVNPVSFGQSIEIAPLGNYHFGGKIRVFEGDITTDPSASYGVSLTVKNQADMGIEAFWLRQDSKMFLERNLGETEELFDVAIEYVTVGAVREMDLDPIKPFFGAGIGVVIFSPQTSEISGETRMAMSLTGGFKYFVNERIGLRIQTQMLLPMQWGSAGVFCGPNGCSGGVGGTTTIIQGTVGGGVILAIGQ